MKPEDIFEVCRARLTYICEPFKVCLGYAHGRSRLAGGPLQFLCFVGLLAFSFGLMLQPCSSSSPLDDCPNLNLQSGLLGKAPL